jgi:hypothetical protein
MKFNLQLNQMIEDETDKIWTWKKKDWGIKKLKMNEIKNNF